VMSYYASQYGATGLVNATSSVATVSSDVPPSSPSSSSSGGLSKGGIVGVSIASVVVFLGIAGGEFSRQWMFVAFVASHSRLIVDVSAAYVKALTIMPIATSGSRAPLKSC
jgi:hypothetical protein